jgi:ABC-type phosphate/phosphonate transport system permease subunit
LYGKTKYSVAIKTARANPALFKESENYNKTAADKNLWKYKDVRVQPRSIWGSLWTFIITAPFVLLAFIFNALPLAVGYICGRKFADDINVISLWRIIPGAAVFMVWIPVVLICGKLYGLAALMISFLGFILYGACKKHFISLVNYLKAPGLKKEFNLAREHAIKEISQ